MRKGVEDNGSQHATSEEFDIYKSLVKRMIERLPCVLQGIIYIRCEPDVCLQRINKRRRSGENAISLQHIRRLNELYEDAISNTETPVFIIDDNELVDDARKAINFFLKPKTE